jgi:hypothetical protein
VAAILFVCHVHFSFVGQIWIAARRLAG